MERAVAAIKHTEKVLRELLAQAAQEGDYPTLMQLTAWARTLHNLVTGENFGMPPDKPRAGFNVVSEEQEQRREKTSATRKKRERSPSFFRTGEELVLVAWSKREKKEYRHKAKFEVLELLMRAMLEKGEGGRVFRTDELGPLKNPGDGTEYPSYKTYVGISFLKHCGAIEQHGRSGYSIPHISNFEKTVRNLYEQLPVME